MDSCLILGGNSGIGAGVANVLSYEGMRVLCPTSNEVDVSIRSHVRSYVTLHGPFTHIVYSAGVNKLQWVREYVRDGWNNMDDTMDVNVGGFVHVIAEHLSAWPGVGASVVAVSSDAAEIPMRGSLAYCMSKAALDMAIKVMARELAPMWRINGVAPGMVEGTAMTKYIDAAVPIFRNWSPEYALEYERSSVPSGRRATIEEVAETIRWVLLGPEQMTGSIIKINGGKA